MIVKNKDIVLGIDPSINGTGLAIFKNGKIIYHGKLTYKQTKKPHYLLETSSHKPIKIDVPLKELRGKVASQYILKLIFDYKINRVVIEDYAFSANSRAKYQIGEFVGAIKNSIYDTNILPEVVSIKKAKKLFTGNGNASKEAVKNQVYLKFGIDAESFDISDAIMLSCLEREA